MSNKSRVFDFSRVKHNEVKQLLEEIEQECRDRSVDGMIVILARKGGKLTHSYTSGSLANHDTAALEALRLQLTMAYEKTKKYQE